MNIKKLLPCLLIVGGCLYQGASAFTQTSFFRPYDTAVCLEDWEKSKFKLEVLGEFGGKSTGRDWDDKRRSVLALHDEKQSALAMIKKSDDTDLISLKNKIDALIGMPAFDDDAVGLLQNAGRLNLTGDYDEWNLNFSSSYKLPINILPGAFWLTVHVPVLKKEVHNTKIEDLTKNNTSIARVNEVGTIIKNDLTGSIKEKVKRWSNLDLNDWEKSGVGDLAILLSWKQTFKQEKESLKNVGVHAKVGVTVPTGAQKDEDKAFSMPLGYDGAWSVPFGLGLELDFVYNLRIGLDADFVAMLDKERDRRMKKTRDQTEFLLLNKGSATKEYGLTWQFHLYAQAIDFLGGLSAKVAYQFVKHDDDRLVPNNNDFDYTIVNSANSLKEWNLHNLIFTLNYDAFKDFPRLKVAPQLSLFYKLPVDGKNIIDAPTFGGQFAFRF